MIAPRRPFAAVVVALSSALVALACSKPAPTEVAAPDAGPGLTKEEIRAVVDAHHAEVRARCLTDAAPDEAPSTLHITVSAGGTVTRVALEHAGDASISRAECFSDQVKTWKFPTGPGEFELPMRIVQR